MKISLALLLVYLATFSYGMRQIPYVLVLVGSTTSTGETTLAAQATGDSQLLTTIITDQFGIETTVRNLCGPTATYESMVTLNAPPATATSFSEVGNITFGENHGSQVHLIKFKTLVGRLNGNIETGVTPGVAVYEITGGEGAFHGAKGFITSNFVLNDTTGTYIDYEAGRIFLP